MDTHYVDPQQLNRPFEARHSAHSSAQKRPPKALPDLSWVQKPPGPPCVSACPFPSSLGPCGPFSILGMPFSPLGPGRTASSLEDPTARRLPDAPPPQKKGFLSPSSPCLSITYNGMITDCFRLPSPPAPDQKPQEGLPQPERLTRPTVGFGKCLWHGYHTAARPHGLGTPSIQKTTAL